MNETKPGFGAYLIIADDEVRATATEHSEAQESARTWSLGRYPTAKVFYMPNRTMQGHWHKGERIQ